MYQVGTVVSITVQTSVSVYKFSYTCFLAWRRVTCIFVSAASKLLKGAESSAPNVVNRYILVAWGSRESLMRVLVYYPCRDSVGTAELVVYSLPWKQTRVPSNS